MIEYLCVDFRSFKQYKYGEYWKICFNLSPVVLVLSLLPTEGSRCMGLEIAACS